LALVNAFDAARSASPGLTSWQLTNALLDAHLSASNDLAFGGDLAYWYSRNRGLTGIGLFGVQQMTGTPSLGLEVQQLHPFSGLQEGFVKLL
jgi:hypothetical protein